MKKLMFSTAVLLLVGAGCTSGSTSVNVSVQPTDTQQTAPADNGRMAPPVDEPIGEPTEDRAYVGTISSIDLTPMTYDGPGIVLIKTADGTEVKVLMPSFGRNLCKAKESIADASALKVGDAVEARGTLNEDGSIVPCVSADHYFRVSKK